MIGKILRSHYGQYFQENDLMLLGVCTRESVATYRERYPGKRIIVFQAEPLLSQSHYWNPDNIIKNIQGADEIWDYDWENYQLLLAQNLPVRFCPLLFSDDNRTCTVTVAKDIDVLVYGLFSERRGQWLHHLHMRMNPNRKIYAVCNVMHPEIDQLVNRSKVIVNWHQHEDQWQQEQTRISWLLTNGKNVVSERSRINYYGGLISEFDTVDEMTDQINGVINSWTPTKELQIASEFKYLTVENFIERAQQRISNETICDQ